MPGGEEPAFRKGWRFRKEVTLGTVVQLVILLGMVMVGWTNLQKELVVIQHDLNRLLSRHEMLCEQLSELVAGQQGHEYRLRHLEQSQPGSGHGYSESEQDKGERLWVEGNQLSLLSPLR